MKTLFASILVALVLIFSSSSSCYAQQQQNCTFKIIDLSGPNIESNVSYSVVASAGILNRETAAVYYYRVESDKVWLQTLVGNKCTGITVDPLHHLSNAVATIKNVILYDEKGAPAFLPSITTLAGVFDAVPIEINLWYTLLRLDPAAVKNATIVFDARSAWTSAAEAVTFTNQPQFLNKTTGFSFSSYQDLKFGGTADVIIHRRWFSSYLNNTCVKGNPNHTIFQNTMEAAPWIFPTGFGYNAQDPLKTASGAIIAYPWEASTSCVTDPKKIALGEACTAGTFNMAFWSRWERDTATQNLVNPGRKSEPNPITYNKSKTYIAMLIMDGDNLEFEQQFTQIRYSQRLQGCQETPDLCAPLAWTISPQMVEFMPAMLRYYYDQAAVVEDFMVFSPGGLFYSYPTMWSDAAQKDYVGQMNVAASKLDITATSDWEWFYDVQNAIDGNNSYYGKYVRSSSKSSPSSSSSTRSNRVSTFLVNTVPWPFNMLLPFLSDEFSQVLGDPNDDDSNVVVARAVFNWCPCSQGGGGWISANETLVASILNYELAVGTVGYFYITRNCDIKYIFELVKALKAMGSDNHVEIVHMNQLESLVRQRARLGKK